MFNFGYTQIYLDGNKLKDKTPLTISQIPAGKHTIKAHKKRYYDEKRRVEILPDKTSRLEVTLKDVPLGWLYVNTVPKDARVRVLNINPRFSQGMELEAGKYHIEVSATGYETRRKWIEVAAGESKKIKMRLVPGITSSIAMKFAYIKAGSFMMGSPSNEPGRDNDEKQHRVTISKPFYMQTTEVTQGQWRKIMGNNPSHFKNCGDDCPVEQVSWNDVQEFIRKLNAREGTNKYRLPTEAEWEYACRAGSTTAFANGSIMELKCGHDAKLDAMGWYCGNAGSKIHAVALKRLNAWGLYDMHGNVWEWCYDWYDKKYPSDHVTDPIGPSSGSNRVNRGGDWCGYAWYCRSACRSNDSPGFRFHYLGFRLARTP